jgi:hypothetical protein
MVSRDTMKEHGLVGGVGQKVCGEGKLLGRCSGAAHRHDHPANPFLSNDPSLIGELGVRRIDRGQRDDRLDPLSRNDPPQR